MRSLPRKFNPEAGISLISVLIAVAVTGIVAAVVSQMLVNSMNTQKHLDLVEEERQLRAMVEKRMSCTATLTDVILKGCSTNLGVLKKLTDGVKFFDLKDKAGRLLGAKDSSGVTRIGNWGLRAQCVKTKTVGTVQVLIAKFAKNGGFAVDPMSKKKLDWAPLYKEDSPLAQTLCSEAILDGLKDEIEADHLVSTVMDEDTKTKGCGDGLLSTILGGPTSLYRGTVNCSSDKRAVSGGAECMPGAGRKNILTLLIGSPKGLMVASRPANNGQGWYTECCLRKGGLLGFGGKTPAPKSYVVCLDKEVVEPKD